MAILLMKSLRRMALGMSLSLKRSSLRELESACIGAFRDKNATRKLSQQNILHNEHFKTLLRQCVTSTDSFVVDESIEVSLKLVEQGLIGPKPILIMAQQYLPPASASKTVQSICIVNFAKLLVRLASTEEELSLVIDFASGEDRIIPILLSMNCSLPFKEFLLGCPEYMVKTMLTSKHFLFSRRCLLSSLAGCPCEESFELLLMFLIWNSGRLTFEELSLLKPIVHFAETISSPLTLNSNFIRLFVAYLECIADAFVTFGVMENDLIASLAVFSNMKSEFNLPDSSLDCLIIALPLLVKSCNLQLAISIIKHASITPSLTRFSMVSVLNVLALYADHPEFLSLCNQINISSSSSTTTFADVPLISIVGKSSLGMLQLLDTGILSELLKESEIDIQFFGQFLSERNIISIAGKLLEFVTAKISECNDSSLSNLLQVWLIEFVERYLNEAEIQVLLPQICRRTSSNANLLYGFVQKKLKGLDFCTSVSQQSCFALSLNMLVSNSESRQSRLNFISSSCLSFLGKALSGEISKLDVRNLILVTKILVHLASILAVDPRIIWVKYFSNCERDSPLLLAAICFLQAFNVIPNDKDGNIDATKLSAIQFFISVLELANNESLLLILAESLARIDVSTLKAAQLSLFQPVTETEGEDNSSSSKLEPLKDSILFCPEKLFNHFSAIKTHPAFERMVAHLVDYEVSIMSRPLFVGADDSIASANVSAFISTQSFHPAFFNELIDKFPKETVDCLDSFIKCFKAKLLTRLPSIPSLLWFVRPFLKEYLCTFVQALVANVDDQVLLKSLAGYQLLLESLKGPSTPQYASSLILAISALQRELYNLHIISEAQLIGGWVAFLVEIWEESNNPFNRFAQNDEFCSALAVSYALFDSCSDACSTVLANALLDQIKSEATLKGPVSMSCSIDALAILSPKLLSDNLNFLQSGLKFFACALTACRYNLDLTASRFTVNDDWGTLAVSLLSESNEILLPAKEPVEFKGIFAFLKCRIDSKSVEAKYADNALNSKNIPSLLKFDSVLYFLCSKGLNLITMSVDGCLRADFLKQIHSSTSDPKTRSLIEFVATRSQSPVPNESSRIGISHERFCGKCPLLYYVCCISGSLKYSILSNCSSIPRISWADLSANDFNFIIKHTISLTPVTNSVYCNPSVLAAFKTHFKIAIDDGLVGDQRKVIEILFSQLSESEAAILYTQLLASLPPSKIEALLKITLEFSSFISKLQIELPPSVDYDFIASHAGLFKELKAKRFDFHDGILSLLLDDAASVREKLTIARDQNHQELLGKLLHSLPSTQKLKILIELLDYTYLSGSTQLVEKMIMKLVSEVNFDYQLQILLACGDIDIREKVANRIENLSDELFYKFQEVFERIEFSASPL